LKKFINLDNKDWSLILETIKKDVDYLKDQKFMDYSLLMAIRKFDDSK
jgi:hypothetical protein